MENQQNQSLSTENCKIFWTDNEVKNLARALTFCFKNSDQYGTNLDINSRIDAFKFVLEGRFSVEQILKSLKTHMGKSTEMFKPAHVTEILDPESKKITQAEYIAALDWQKRNGYPAYSAEAVLIREYEKQNAEDRAPLYGQPISIGLQQKLKIENQKGKP